MLNFVEDCSEVAGVVCRDKNTSSNMKIDTLSFLNLLLTSHSPSVFHSHVDTLVKVSVVVLVAVDNLPITRTQS